jgi:hypothetical protein
VCLTPGTLSQPSLRSELDLRDLLERLVAQVQDVTSAAYATAYLYDKKKQVSNRLWQHKGLYPYMTDVPC